MPTSPSAQLLLPFLSPYRWPEPGCQQQRQRCVEARLCLFCSGWVRPAVEKEVLLCPRDSAAQAVLAIAQPEPELAMSSQIFQTSRHWTPLPHPSCLNLVSHSSRQNPPLISSCQQR